MEVSSRTRELRQKLDDHCDEIQIIVGRYGGRNLRLFGSVADGTAGERSDIDLLVDLDERPGSKLLRLAGITQELIDLLGEDVDVVTLPLLRKPVAETALAGAVTL